MQLPTKEIKMTDLIYYTDKMFTRFIPETDAGVVAYNQMAEKINGVPVVFNFEAARVIKQLRDAGYLVAKAKKTKTWVVSDDELMAELTS